MDPDQILLVIAIILFVAFVSGFLTGIHFAGQKPKHSDYTAPVTYRKERQ